jgi:hypothetical protein
MLRKSLAAGVIFRSQLLNWVSTPVMLLFLLGKPTLFLMMCTSEPVRIRVCDESVGGLASMLY